MTLTVIKPPTFRELLENPVYRSYVLKTPRLPGQTANPWRVWGLRHDDKWAGKLFQDYRPAFDLLKSMIKDRDKYADAVIICRPTLLAPPAHFVMEPDFEWCGRCRRPTVYRRMTSHVEMRKWAAVDTDPAIKRCLYCAMRRPDHQWY